MKDIKNYENYQVSEQGQVWAKHLKRYLIPQDNGAGYLQCRLRNSKGRKAFYVHRLVATHYLDNPLGLSDVNHIDGVKGNNTVSNLEWLSHQNNLKHAYAAGLLGGTASLDYVPVPKPVKGVDRRTLTKKFQVSKTELEDLLWEHPYTYVASLFGVSDNAIRKRAKKLSCNVPPPRFHNRSKGERERIMREVK